MIAVSLFATISTVGVDSASNTRVLGSGSGGVVEGGQWAAVQPYLSLGGNGTPTGSGTGTLEVLVADMAILSCTISGSYSYNTATPPVWTTQSTVTWNTGYIPSPDIPVGEASRSTTNPVPVIQGNFPVSGTAPSSTPGIFMAANYSVLYVPPGASLRISGSGTADGSPTNILMGLALSTVPQAAFTASGSGPVSVDGSASLDGVRFPGGPYIDDPDNFISAYVWSWGDGTSDTTTTPTATHEYSAVGTYTVTLEIRDKYAGRNRTTQSVTVTAADTGRLVSLSFDANGLMLAQVQSATPKPLLIRVYDGQHYTERPSLNNYQLPCLVRLPGFEGTKYLLAQVKESKVIKFLASSDFGRMWKVMSEPWDANTSDAVGCGMPGRVIMSARVNKTTKAIEVKVSRDGGKNWLPPRDANNNIVSPGGDGKSLSIWRADGGSSRIYLSNAGTSSTTTKYTDDMGCSWKPLPV